MTTVNERAGVAAAARPEPPPRPRGRVVRRPPPTAAQTDPFRRALPVAEPRKVWTHTRRVLRGPVGL